MTAAFTDYLAALRKTPRDKKTEHTDRAALEALLNAFAGEADSTPHVQHEPKRIAEKGAPDFKVTRLGLILGYVESKAIGIDLRKVEKSDQIARYKSLSRNILLTDYLEFVWITPDGTQRAALCDEDALDDRKARLDPDRIQAVAALITGFFSSPPQQISRSRDLALALAQRSRLLRDYLGEELVRQEKVHQEGRLYGLYQTFRDQIFHELTPGDFADAFAQMLAYGLFLARLNSGSHAITLHNAREYVPGSFRLIQELVDFLTELDKPEYAEVRWVVQEVLSIVNGLDLAGIHEDLSFRHRRAISRKVRAQDEEEHRLFERDPFIYFYEDYLKAYDKDMRKGRGVYYTPPPIVNFIVRAVDDILKDTFGIDDGLADHKRVTVLDFACGTGTFLLEVFQRIFDNIGGADSGKADLIVRQHMLKNLYGFEYLIAPYTIAHLKLSQFLKDKGHALKDEERLQVFLTNTLEPIKPQQSFLLPAVTAEVKAAQEVKDKPILVITGNPPYSAHSKNTGGWITSAIEAYKIVDGKPFGEKKHWLHDDYVKFIRFAQMKMDGGLFEYRDEKGNLQSLQIEGADRGIIGVITNHSWLDNPTFRGMRQSLMHSFEQIYVLDLHGNSKKKESAPDGSRDENIFDIEQGVSIAIFVKNPGAERGVWRGDLWGARLAKYHAAAEADRQRLITRKLEPASPFYLFSPLDAEKSETYSTYWSIVDIMPVNVAGVISARDDFAIGFDKTELVRRIAGFERSKKDNEALSQEFGLKDTRGWSPAQARDALSKAPDWKTTVKPILYRPFDERVIAHDQRLIDWGRWNLMRNLQGEPSLVCVRQVAEQTFDHAIVTTEIADNRLTRSSKGTCYQFPLYRHDEGKKENISPAFRTFLDARYRHHYSPEEILGYIYAVLHAPGYRSAYAEFLRIDFPRIPFPEEADDFEALSKLGWALVEAHLLRRRPTAKLALYHGKGDHLVEAVRYDPAGQAIWINKTQYFKPVPETVWNFHIGGYAVLDKYLKSRKGRTLSLDEIGHLARVADALAFTIAQMERIDTAYSQAFADRG